MHLKLNRDTLIGAVVRRKGDVIQADGKYAEALVRAAAASPVPPPTETAVVSTRSERATSPRQRLPVMSEHLEIVSGPVVVSSGTTTLGSPVVSGLDTSALAGAVWVKGAGIPRGTLVRSIDSDTTITLSANATASGTPSLTFRLEPVSLAEAKLHLKQDGIDNDDPLIARLIAACRLQAEVRLRQTILLTTYDLFMDGFPASANGYYSRQIRQMGMNPQWLPNGAAIISLPKPPLVAVESVKYLNASGTIETIDPSIYSVSTGFGSRVQPLTGRVWPVTQPQIDGVVIRYTAGWATADEVSENVQAAILLIIGTNYEFRESVVAGTTPAKVTRTVEDLLDASKHGAYA